MELSPSNPITQDWYVRADFEIGAVNQLTKQLKPGMVCLDIGADVGFYNLLMSKRVGPEGFVFAFETPQEFAAQWQSLPDMDKTGLTLIDVVA